MNNDGILFPGPAYQKSAEEAATGCGASEPYVAQLLYSLAVANGCKRILEVGSFFGHTTIWLALAAQSTGGVVTSVDHRPDCLDKVLGKLREAKVEHSARLVAEDAGKFIEMSLTQRSTFDLIFYDCERDPAAMARHCGGAWDLLSVGGMLCIHDIFNPVLFRGVWLDHMHPQAIRVVADPMLTDRTLQFCGLGIVQKQSIQEPEEAEHAEA
jgi:predicted O-methyltransferase YrrM